MTFSKLIQEVFQVSASFSLTDVNEKASCHLFLKMYVTLQQ